MEIIGIEKMTYENILLEIEKFLDRTNNLANDYSLRKLITGLIIKKFVNG